MDAARDLSELVERSTELLGNERLLAPELAGRLRRHPLGRACLQRERDEALLNPVMEVALELASGLVSRRDDTSPGCAELVTCLRIRDRRRDQVCEVGDSPLDSVRQWIGCR